jgi:hypothetical protein
MTARSCQLSATPVRYPRLRQRASTLGHVCTSARHTSSRRGRTSSRLCRTSRPRQSRVATSHLVPHIRDIWSRSARDHPSAASRGSSERSLREFVNDYTAVLAVPFYIATRSLDGAIGDRPPSADGPLMHGQADKRLTYRHSSDGAAGKHARVDTWQLGQEKPIKKSWVAWSGNATYEVLCTPGRSRTDTGDPFRGPASSFGLRGLHEDTPNGSDKRTGGGLLWVRSEVNFTYSIPLSGIADTLRYHFTTSITLSEHTVRGGPGVTGQPTA